MASSAAPAMRPFLCYTAKSGGGRALCVRNAPSQSALSGMLRKERQTMLRAYPLPAALAPEQTLALKDQAVLNEQLHALLSRGVPLVEAMDVVAGTVTPSARPVVTTMREQVASGVPFSEACARSGVLDNVTVAIYRAAERSGDLSGAARQLAVSQRRTLQVVGRAQSLLIYPVVLLIVTAMITLALLVGVLPKIAEGLANMASDVKLPLYSQVIFSVGVFLREHIIVFSLVLMVLVALAIAGRSVLKTWFIRFGQRAPLVRDVTLASEMAQFFTVMSAMSKSGVPLADGLATANQVVQNPELRKQLDGLRSKLVAGGLLRSLIEGVTAMPLATRRLLLAAERSGDLDAAFASLAADMTEEVEKGSARLMAFLQPALIVLMTAVVGSVMFSILLPILTISGRVGAG